MHKLLTSVLFVGLFVGCASGDPLPSDAGRRDGGGDAGPMSTIHCGEKQGPCCQPGRICESGLHCGNGDRCCATPGGAPCAGPQDCCVGLQCVNQACVAPTHGGCTLPIECGAGQTCSGGVCIPAPTTDGCGASGQTCCPGFVCDSGLACDDGMCGACGDDGQPCCQGDNPCISGSLACNTSTLTCGTLPPCGNEGTPCCLDNSCAGALKCVGGSCIVDTTCGGLDEACCTRNTCDSNLICDATMAKCVTPPDDCGQSGQMCCTTSPSGECVGELNCESGSCSDCQGPSGICLFSSQCCNGATCRFASFSLHCCVGSGATCTNAADCCGLMACVGGMCQGEMNGGLCIDSSSCAEGFHCEIPFCRPDAATACSEPSESCNDTTNRCCTGLLCQTGGTNGGFPAPGADGGVGVDAGVGVDGGVSTDGGVPTSGERACCAYASTGCAQSEDCCGRMTCAEGVCQCGVENDLCNTADGSDCCEGFTCIGGACTSDVGCALPEEECTSSGDCCGTIACGKETRAATTRQCCESQNELCFNDDQCCGPMVCGTNHRCVGRVVGETCANSSDCVGSAICDEGGHCV